MSKKKHSNQKAHVAMAGKVTQPAQAAKAAQSAQFAVPAGAFDVAIIGGGASGITCAIACAQAAHAQGKRLRIGLFESGKRIGASIMRSGNGRCNFSNSHLEVDKYHNAAFVRQSFEALEESSMPSVLSWFKSLGLVWEEMPGSGGLLYPLSRKANSVLDVLRVALDELQVEVFERTEMTQVTRNATAPSGMTSAPSCYHLQGEASVLVDSNMMAGPSKVLSSRAGSSKAKLSKASGKQAFESVPFTIFAQRVVVAVGGPAVAEDAWADLLPADVKTLPGMPVLGPLRARVQDILDLPSIPNSAESQAGSALRAPGEGALRQTVHATNHIHSLKPLDGVRMMATVTVPNRGFAETGEVLFRSYGISGIVVFNASRFAQPGDTVLLDLLPHLDEERAHALLAQRAELFAQRPARTFLTGFVVASVSDLLLELLHANPDLPISPDQVDRLAHLMKAVPLRVEGMGDERTCQVHRGGVRPDQVDPRTLELKAHPGFHVLGEALDVDGSCGGYNLHWAWTTGLLAGAAAAQVNPMPGKPAGTASSTMAGKEDAR